MPRWARISSRELKLSVIRRLAGENVSALARELQVGRKDLQVWRDRYRAGGAAALRSRGRPPKLVGTALAAVESWSVPDALATAQRRIAELERKIGQQQLELVFFSEPCGKSASRAESGAMPSRRSSRR
jgi:transposase